mmetsp:Transcript_10321/g.26772  ORF Transcript_10321/g.26772 Transcript_10321/m.26772 type:complete len:203 (-) Transcript_10321:102-710(-)
MSNLVGARGGAAAGWGVTRHALTCHRDRDAVAPSRRQQDTLRIRATVPLPDRPHVYALRCRAHASPEPGAWQAEEASIHRGQPQGCNPSRVTEAWREEGGRAEFRAGSSRIRQHCQGNTCIRPRDGSAVAVRGAGAGRHPVPRRRAHAVDEHGGVCGREHVRALRQRVAELDGRSDVSLGHLFGCSRQLCGRRQHQQHGEAF